MTRADTQTRPGSFGAMLESGGKWRIHRLTRGWWVLYWMPTDGTPVFGGDSLSWRDVVDVMLASDIR